MPWQEHQKVELRKKFIVEALAPGRNMTQLAARFGIQRKTAYEWLNRFKAEGLAGLEDRSHRPHRISGTSGEMVLRIFEVRQQYKHWGPKKLRELLKRELGKAPAERTIGRILKRLQMPPLRIKRARKPSAERAGGALMALNANDVWTFDFKGWWRTLDGKRFEPLTVRDAATRFILLCVHSRETFAAVKEHCERLFIQYGLPLKIRVDNGPPFACRDAIGGLSRLSAWWISLGIDVSFSKPSTPSDNGAHERMHNDMWRELELDPAANTKMQQAITDEWVRVFNEVRPHEAIQMRTPASLYKRSPRRIKVLVPTYPADVVVTRVSARGRIQSGGFQYFVGTNLCGMRIGIRRSENKMSVLFYGRLLGDLESTPQRAR